MTKAAARILAGLEDAIAYVQGDQTRGRAHVIQPLDEVDVKAIRRRLGLSQAAFAQHYGFSLSAVRHWEQHRRRPEGSTRMLLMIIAREPEAVERALAMG